jgi:hypothetical protein
MRKAAIRTCPALSDSGPYWVKSSFSYANGQCVEVAGLPNGTIGVRDSKKADGPILQFSSAEWQTFVNKAKNGEFDKLT